MERFRAHWGVLWLMLGVASSAAAESGERVALFVIGDLSEQSERVIPVVEQVRAQLAKDGREEVRPEVSRNPGREIPLDEAKAIGRQAFSQLANRPPETVLAEYGARIREAVGQVSSVFDGEGRTLLWNLCVLEVHLLLSTASADEQVREAVLDCSRRFVDRPPLGKDWGQEVARAFERHAADLRQVPLSVKSSPAGCDLFLYGAKVGVTPTIIDVNPGPHEVQIACDSQPSAVHRMNVEEARDLVIRLDADTALAENDGVSWLQYEASVAASQAVEDAAALASEARADSFVLVKAQGPEVVVEWVRLPAAALLGDTSVAVASGHEQRARLIEGMFRGMSSEDAVPSRRRARHRVWADYAVGGGLFTAGVALSVYPLLAIVRDGRCVDSNCDAIYRGKSPAGIVMVTAAGLLSASGLAIVWRGPFGRRTSVTLGNGIHVKGAF